MSDKLPAQRVIDAAMAYLHGKVGDGSYPEFLLAVRAYEASDDPGVVLSRATVEALVAGPGELWGELDAYKAAEEDARAALEAKR